MSVVKFKILTRRRGRKRQLEQWGLMVFVWWKIEETNSPSSGTKNLTKLSSRNISEGKDWVNGVDFLSLKSISSITNHGESPNSLNRREGSSTWNELWKKGRSPNILLSKKENNVWFYRLKVNQKKKKKAAIESTYSRRVSFIRMRARNFRCFLRWASPFFRRFRRFM